MSTSWAATDLHTDPPSYQMAATDRRRLEFAATPETTGATAHMRMDTGATVNETLDPVTFDAATSTIYVTVHSLTRGVTYELSIIEAKPGGYAETSLTAIQCVGKP